MSERPRVPSRADIEAAALRLRGLVFHTPLVRSRWLSERARAEVFLKLENVQPTGSFKIRGAMNAVSALLSRQPEAKTVVTASAGNHGLALATAGRHFGVEVRVHLPVTAPEAKRRAIAAAGARVLDAPDYDAAEEGGRQDAARTGVPYISPYNDADVMAGAGTVALEMLEDQPDLDALVVPLGGGGLVAGSAIFVAAESSRRIRVIGAEAEASPVFSTSLTAGAITTVEVRPTLADGLAGNLEPGSVTFDLVRDHVDMVALVAESSLELAMRGLVVEERLIAEGAGAAGVAAVLQGLRLDGCRVGVMVTGRNVDWAVLARVLPR